MSEEGCTPVEVPAVLLLPNKDLAVRCLEVVRSHLTSIIPGNMTYRVQVIALCHHHPANRYPAFGIFGAKTWEEVVDAETRINAWVASRGLPWLIEQSATVEAPTWDSL